MDKQKEMTASDGAGTLGVAREPALVRSLLSFGFAFTAEWAFTVAIGLVAFADGGAVAVGLVGLLRLCRRRCWRR